MNGKYMGWREQRWTNRDAKRLEHIREKREAKAKNDMLRADKGAPAKSRPDR